MVPSGAMLDTMLNLTQYHREHELFYSRAPLEDALRLQTMSRALKAAAMRWRGAEAPAATEGGDPKTAPEPVRDTGCQDLNDRRAVETMGILFMARRGPAGLLGGSPGALIELRPVADLLGDRHRIIINNWQMAWDMKLVARLVRRVAEVLEAVAPSPEALRADLANPRTAEPRPVSRRAHRHRRGPLGRRRTLRA